MQSGAGHRDDVEHEDAPADGNGEDGRLTEHLEWAPAVRRGAPRGARRPEKALRCRWTAINWLRVGSSGKKIYGIEGNQKICDTEWSHLYICGS